MEEDILCLTLAKIEVDGEIHLLKIKLSRN